YQNNMSTYRNETDEKRKDFQERLSSTGASIKDRYNRERQQLVRAQEDGLTESNKDAAQKRSALKNRIDYSSKQKQIDHVAEKEQMKQYTEDRMSAAQKRLQERTEALSKDYSQRNENLADAQLTNTKQTNRQHQDILAEVQRGYNDSLRKIELEKRRRDN